MTHRAFGFFGGHLVVAHRAIAHRAGTRGAGAHRARTRVHRARRGRAGTRRTRTAIHGAGAGRLHRGGACGSTSGGRGSGTRRGLGQRYTGYADA